MTTRKTKEYVNEAVNLMTIINQAREWNAPLNEIIVSGTAWLGDNVVWLYWAEEETE